MGDAMGRLAEFIDHETIVHQFGASGIVEPPPEALYTDDTQLAMATARALIESGDRPIPQLIAATSSQYLSWLDTQDSPLRRRGPGVLIMDALGRLRRGVPHSAASDGGANESIAATRSIPVALRYHGNPQHIIEAAAEIGRITHGHPAAVSGASAAALLVEYALSGVPLEEWPRKAVLQLKRWCPDDTHHTVEAIRTAERTADWSQDAAMEAHCKSRPGFGGGWTADEVVGIGLWCVLREPSDFAGAVRTAVNLRGDNDSDSIATVVGALLGAAHGVEAIPADWLDRLEDRDELTRLAGELYALNQGA